MQYLLTCLSEFSEKVSFWRRVTIECHSAIGRHQVVTGVTIEDTHQTFGLVVELRRSSDSDVKLFSLHTDGQCKTCSMAMYQLIQWFKQVFGNSFSTISMNLLLLLT